MSTVIMERLRNREEAGKGREKASKANELNLK